MKILMIAPECAPFSKVGGLADMVASLSKEMAASGDDVRIFTPLYRCVKRDDSFELALSSLSVHLGFGVEEFCAVWKKKLGGAEVYFSEFNKFYDRPGIYNEGGYSYQDNGARFAFLSKAAIEFCQATGWIPDVVHCHDWTVGFVPVYLNTIYRSAPIGKAASVFTIHNMQHQGIFPLELLDYAGLPSREVFKPDNLEALGNVNMMKGGIYNSTKITTVSPTYAREIQSDPMGCGLDDVLRFKAADMVGVVNGIDYDEWNPRTDKLIPANYDENDFSGKAKCKAALQKKLGLDVNSKIPIFGVVSRLYDQKGLDMLANIVDPLMANMQIQIALLGSGEKWLEDAFLRFSHVYKGRVGTYIGYDNSLAHLIEAGSDFFLMPSRFEPCGLNQLYSMAYGTPPIARATGGLVDTITSYSEGGKKAKGDGFLFGDATTSALYNTIGWACSTYYDRPKDYVTLRQNGMKKDFSWKNSSAEYKQLYKWAVDQRAFINLK